MSFIRPFKGLRFTSEAGDMKDLMAPPYDVIDGRQRDQLYKRSKFNISRVTKSDVAEKESASEKYSFAAKEWQRWRSEGITEADEVPCFYFYEQEFELNGQKIVRLGLIAAHKLVEFGEGVHPHEHTLSGPKADRFQLLSQCKAHFGQIFSIYDDEGGELDAWLRTVCEKSDFCFEAKDDDGIVHRLSKCADRVTNDEIVKRFSDKEMIIADGHHRYETGLKYSKEKGTLESSYLMMTVVSLANPGLQILPTHRLVKNLPSFDKDKLIAQLKEKFVVRQLVCDVMQAKEKRDELMTLMKLEFQKRSNCFGAYFGKGEFALLKLKSGSELSGSESVEFRNLDVAILHGLILDELLGINNEKLAAQENLEYIKDIGEAVDESISKVDLGSHQVLFLMNSPKMEQTSAIARNGEKMPQKSTFFYPKVFTGLVTYPVEPGVVES